MQKKICVIAQFGLLMCFHALLAAAPNFDFDHLQTGYELSAAHRRVECSQCHVNAVFRGTPRRCAFCHSGAGFIRGTSKPIKHVPTNEDCDNCHRGSTWTSARFDHSIVVDNCNRCHNGSSATPKDNQHIRSTSGCEDCHRSSAWIPVLRVEHNSVIGTCFSCHNGTISTAKNATHIRTTNVCEDCHRTNAWTPVTRVDHNHVIGTCISCHNGTIAVGTAIHPFPVPGLDCALCHNTNSWK